MGTKLHYRGYLPEYYSMRDLNEDSSSNSWPPCYGDKIITSGQYNNGFMPSARADSHPVFDKDALKQKMLEHEAVFKNQVYELHRLYRIQREIMEEVRRKELHRQQPSIEPSSSSNLHGSQVSPEAAKWHMAGFSLSDNSPMNCINGGTTRCGLFPFHNGSGLNDPRALDSRSLKARRNLFDLQLPADKYIDLNEPVQIDESMAPSSTDFLGVHSSINGEAQDKNHPAKSNAGYLGVNGEAVHIPNGFSIKSSLESKVSEGAELPSIFKAGSSKSKLGSLTQGHLPDMLPIPSHPVQGMFTPGYNPPGTYKTGYSRGDLWREGNHHGIESSDRSYDHSNDIQSETLLPSHAPGSYPYFSSSSFIGSRAYPVACWAKPIDISSQASAQGRELFGGKPVTASSSLNPGLVSELAMINGCHQGSASRSKELPAHLHSAGFDHLSCHKDDDLAYEVRTINGFWNSHKGSDSKPSMDINLNEVSKSSSNEPVILHDLTFTEGRTKHEDDLSALHWLKRSCGIVREKEISETRNAKTILGFPISALENEPPPVVSTTVFVGCSAGPNNATKERKNRMFDINLEYEPDEQMAATELTVEKERIASVRDYIDLNACVSEFEDPSAPSYESKTGTLKRTLDIDLETPILLESEDTDMPSKDKTAEKKDEQMQDEDLRNAAETIFAISSSCSQILINDGTPHPSEASLAESLLWFADAVTNELENASDVRDSSPKKDFSGDTDDFEAMTLQIPGTKEEDYMPVPFIPIVEDKGGITSTTRSRRGQSRRGRQRRDFQRDILPGLGSLSRYEVTEDLQTFGGMMRATGHQWDSGLRRRNANRNGCTRGRKRAAVEHVAADTAIPVCTQLHKIDAGLEDRSLAGWGKTIRRPRRQRCSAVNPPTLVLS